MLGIVITVDLSNELINALIEICYLHNEIQRQLMLIDGFTHYIIKYK